MSWRISDAAFEAEARKVGSAGDATRLRVTIGGGDAARVVDVEARVERDGLVITLPDGRVVRAASTRDAGVRWVSVGGRTFAGKLETQRRGAHDHHHGGAIEAPMPGKIVRLAVAVGDVVKKGQLVLTLEAMKMEHALKAPRDGVVSEVNGAVGELVSPGRALVVLEEATP